MFSIFMFMISFIIHVQFQFHVSCYFIQLLTYQYIQCADVPFYCLGGLHFTMQVLIYRTIHLLSRTASVSAYW